MAPLELEPARFPTKGVHRWQKISLLFSTLLFPGIAGSDHLRGGGEL